jgi:predicted permease
MGRHRRSRVDIEEEVRSHLEHEADALVVEGMTRSEARAEARARFGDVSRAFPPDAWTRRSWVGGVGRLIAELARDAGLALRTLRREPGFTVVAILTLVLGIGLNCALFSFLYSLTMRGLPLPDADRLVTIHQTFTGMPLGHFGSASMKVGDGSRYVNGTSDMVSYPEYLAYRDRARSLSGLAGFASVDATMAGEPALRVSAFVVTCSYFQVLRAPVLLGRGLEPGDCGAAGQVPVVVLGYGLWQSRFGGDGGIVGRTIRLDRTRFTVVGVAGRDFTGTGLEEPDLWVPVTMEPDLAPDRLRNPDLSWLALVGRLRPGATPEGTATELTGIGRSRDTSYPGRRTTVLVDHATLASGPILAAQVRSSRIGAFSLAGLILLIACLNVASLMLARMPARQRAVRIRRALGAARHQVVGQLLVESLLLAFVGGGMGLALSIWLPGVFARILVPGGLPVDAAPDLRIVGYALGVSFIAALLFGLMPSLETSRIDLASALRSDTPGGGPGPRTYRLRKAVVAAQLAGSLLLLVLAGLFARSFVLEQRADLGFRIDHIYGFRPDLGDEGYSAEQAAAFLDTWKTRVAALPGVQGAALTSALPLDGQSAAVFVRDPNAAAPDFKEGQVFFVYVSPGYFATMGIPILRGAGLPATRPASGEPQPAVIGETMAHRYWPNQEALGQVFAAPNGEPRRVVGIARDAFHGGWQREGWAFFWSAIPPRAFAGTLVVRVAAHADATPEVLAAARQLDSNVLVSVTSLHDVLEERLRPARVAALLYAALGLLALLLAAVGVYGAAAYGVSQRSHEFGVRVALGASRGEIRSLVLRQGLLTVAIGVAAGLLAAGVAAQLVRGQLYGIAPLDPLVFLGIAGALVGVAVAAMLRPARRACSLDPAETLRGD